MYWRSSVGGLLFLSFTANCAARNDNSRMFVGLNSRDGRDGFLIGAAIAAW